MYVTLSIEPAAAVLESGTDLLCQSQVASLRQRHHAIGTYLFREGGDAANLYEIRSGAL